MDLTVLICTWNRAQSLHLALDSIARCVVPAPIQWEVLIVDNNSTDATKQVCESFIAQNPNRFRYLFEPKQGKTNALNSGIQAARGEIIALTDDDLTVDPNWLGALYAAFQQFDCAAVGGKIVPVWNSPKPSWLAFDGPFRHPAYGGIVNFDKGDAPCELHCSVVGANMAVRKTIFAKYGPYCPDLNRVKDLLGGEDTEYCRRLLSGGERLMYAPNAVVYHPVEPHRATWKYLQSMAFHYGRWMVRMDGIPESAERIWRIPKYLFPKATNSLLKWLTSLNRQARAFFRLEFCLVLGQMSEARASAGAQSMPLRTVGSDPAAAKRS